MTIPSSKKFKVAIVDDHSLFREGLISLLKEYKELDVVLQAANGRELINALEDGEKIDVVLLDIDMPVMDGIKAAEIIRKKYPGIKILVITMYDDLSFVNRFYEMGANGFLLKDSASEKIVEAINYVMKNGGFFSGKKDMEVAIGSKTESCLMNSNLTEREIEVIGLLCRQFQNKEIAEMLCISIRTVDTHRENIMEKIGAKNVAGIVAFGVQNNLHLVPIKNKNG